MSFSEWREVKVSEIGKIVTGKTPKTAISENYGGNIPFLTPSDDMNIKKVKSTARTLSEMGLNSVKNCLLPAKSICVSCIGSVLGKVVLTSEPTVTNQQINSIVPDEKFDPDFIYYGMTILGKHLNYLSKTSTAVPIINKTTFSNFSIIVPTIEEQKAIAHILSTLDDKIEVNNQINKTLENMAQAIFKQWFVDFEFSNEDGEPYKSSGGEMIDSELGEIPEGWETVKLGDYVEVKYGKDHKKLVEGDFPVYGSGGIMRYVDTFLYSGESVLIPRKGTLGNVMYVNEAFWSVDTMFYTVMRTRNIAKFIYLFLNRIDLKSMNVGSAVPSMTTNILNNMKIIKPPSQILEQFDSLIAPMFQMIKHNKEENKTLEDTRDALLPKLLSGDLELGGLLDEE